MKSPLPHTYTAAIWLSVALFSSISTSNLLSADWPQWRGPTRNGIANGSEKLPDELSKENPPIQVWKSDEIPSDHYGGHGSVIVSKGKVLLSIVWHRDEPTATRKIDSGVLSKLGYRGIKFSDELVAKMENDRLNLNPRLRGGKLDEWAEKWVNENLDEKQRLSLGSWVIGRFKKGKTAISIADFKKLETVRNKEFAGQAEIEKWVKSQGFEPDVEKRILDNIPATKKVANDVVLCLDENTGKKLWKFETEGKPTGRGSSSTPAASGDRVYAALSTGLYCVNQNDGTLAWKAPLTGRGGPASSPLILNGKVFLQQNFLTAFDAKNGEILWTNKDANGSNPSPASWQSDDTTVIICNTSKAVIGVDAETGKTLWTQPGGGDASPTVSGDYLVVPSKSDGRSLAAFKLSPTSATELWAKDFRTLRYHSSPIIYDGHAYYLGSKRHLCINLESGKIAWERDAANTISSPLLSDGKLVVYDNNGGMLTMIKADPDDYNALGKTKIGALRSASPALVGTRLYFRAKDHVTSYELKSVK